MISLPLAILALLAAGAVVPALELTRIKHYTYNNNGHGAYSFEYETSDGTYRHEDGGVSWPGNLIVRGEYGYIDPTGKLHVVKYIADENGFQPLTGGTEDTRFNDRRIV